ncbi:MFS transporter [Algoriphagus aestuariicola]|uniref:MFS transporter n=1 Tax=Algoriphagus aestuariicola TaxID=1852016 RepID=A0ABS3BJ71_9BACT|nr:MFS transporter [Algoriphagus aestuariicola]MBN7799347.1 MFS transporter [Algoriphagus aestuariicola]
MTQTINRGALFNASCLALITTAFSFSIRAGILPQLGDSFGLSAEQLGFINSMWFFGFPISMILGGLFYHKVGPANIMRIAFITHTLGILLTIFAGGYTTLLISTLFIGFGNGCTEAACNPLIADMYSGTTLNKMLNRFHMWFPGGIVLGSLVSKFMTDGGFAWQSQVWVMMIPTIAYAVLFFGKTFPKPHVEAATSIGSNIKAMFSPVFIFLFFAMALTAITEFGPQQWVGLIMGASGASPMLILALTTGVMAVGRFFAGPVVKALGQTGVLLGGAIFASLGIFLFSTVTGPMAYVAAFVFAIGVCYFWPVMVGAVAQRVPLSGALGMSIIGGIGMFSTAIFQPFIGSWIDNSMASQSAAGLSGAALELAAGQETLQKILIFPGILIVLFIIFFVWQKGSKPAVAAAH